MNRSYLFITAVASIFASGIVSGVCGSASPKSFNTVHDAMTRMATVTGRPEIASALTLNSQKKVEIVQKIASEDPDFLNWIYVMALYRRNTQPAVLEAFSSPQNPTFTICGVTLSPAEVRGISHRVISNHVTSLIIKNCYMSEPLTTELLTALKDNDTLITLVLYNRTDKDNPERKGVIGTVGANALGTLLSQGTIQVLDLTMNTIEKAAQIVEGLKIAPLNGISLVGCDISTAETQAILHALPPTTLRILRISASTEIMLDLCDFIRKSKRLSQLFIKNCGIDEASYKLLIDTLQHIQPVPNCNLSLAQGEETYLEMSQVASPFISESDVSVLDEDSSKSSSYFTSDDESDEDSEHAPSDANLDAAVASLMESLTPSGKGPDNAEIDSELMNLAETLSGIHL